VPIPSERNSRAHYPVTRALGANNRISHVLAVSGMQQISLFLTRLSCAWAIPRRFSNISIALKLGETYLAPIVKITREETERG
jgi:hypothetical protein